MHRLGFALEDMPRLIEPAEGTECRDCPFNLLTFGGSDSQQFDSFTRGR